MGIIPISIVAAFALLLALLLIVRGMVSRDSGLPLTAEWIDELSADRYRPMARLLDGRDLSFLRSQPGFNRRMAARMRAQRCQIFRAYLKCLSGDFQRVCTAIKVLMLQSPHDRPDLAAALVRHQATFAFGMAAVHVQLALYRFGLGGVDATNLVGAFDTMRAQLRTLTPAAATL